MTTTTRRAAAALLIGWLALPDAARAADTAFSGPTVAGVPIDFLLFALVLVGVALFHHHTLKVAVVGAIVIATYKMLLSPFSTGEGVGGFVAHVAHEGVTLANLFGLLVGFALLAEHFAHSKVPTILPRYLPTDWRGGFVLLILVFVMSSFLDNIAAAMIGGGMAASLYQRKVHIGFLAAIVAASNAGGAGSVVGDTTTTMMWIAGAAPLQVLDAYTAAIPALLFFGVVAARQQHAHQPMNADVAGDAVVDWPRVAIVGLMLVAAVGANIFFNLRSPATLDRFPVIGTAVWVALLATAGWRKPDWPIVPDAIKGSIFLLSLVLCASMMPVEKLPAASWPSTLGLGFVSAVFDNIPLTALALRQGGYDWGMLAYAVGFGGSMIWFGSSAGVALSNLFNEARSVGAWLKGGWHVSVGYLIGFAVLMVVHGWDPEPLRKAADAADAAASAAAAASAPTR